MKEQVLNQPTFALLRSIASDHRCLKHWTDQVAPLVKRHSEWGSEGDGLWSINHRVTSTIATRLKINVTEIFPMADALGQIDWQVIAEFVVQVARSQAQDELPAVATANARFCPERIKVSKGAVQMLDRSEIGQAIARHLEGDWGDVSREDREQNERALKSGGRLMSAFGQFGKRVWLITDGEPKETRLLLPEEY